MLRRRVAEKFLGRNNLEIPMTHPVEDIWVELSVEEHLIYKKLEGRFTDNLNSEMAAGRRSQKVIRSFFALLTRLRQGVGHPFLLESAIHANFTLEDLKFLQVKLGRIAGRTPVHEQLRASRVPGAVPVVMEYDVRREIGRLGPEEPFTFGRGHFGYYFDMHAHINGLYEQKGPETLVCRYCNHPPEDPYMTQVRDSLSLSRLFLPQQIPSAREDLDAADESLCPVWPLLLSRLSTRDGNARAGSQQGVHL